MYFQQQAKNDQTIDAKSILCLCFYTGKKALLVNDVAKICCCEIAAWSQQKMVEEKIFVFMRIGYWFSANKDVQSFFESQDALKFISAMSCLPKTG